MHYSKSYMNYINSFFKDHKIFHSDFKESSFYTDKVLCIPGGAGSIGSILALKLLTLPIKKLIVIDNSEYSIFKLKQQIDKNYQAKIEIKFLSILNKKLLEKIFKQNKIDILYNCAAIKHVDIAEENKEETFRVNVEGTKNLLQLSQKYKIQQFIFISSDKAFYPQGVMGKSKLQAENMILKHRSSFQKKILRFPNVISSSGSLIEVLYECIINKKVFYLKNKNLRRYFIFKSDTVIFILKSTVLPVQNKIIVLENVKEKKIIHLVKYLQKKYKLQIKLSQLPAFEKIAERYSDFKLNKVFI